MLQFLISMKSYHPASTAQHNLDFASNKINMNDSKLMCKDETSRRGEGIETINNKHYNIVIGREYRDIIACLINNEANNSIPLFLEASFESNPEYKHLSFIHPLSMMANMTESGLRLLNEENAGGNSEYSEAFSYEFLE